MLGSRSSIFPNQIMLNFDSFDWKNHDYKTLPVIYHNLWL